MKVKLHWAERFLNWFPYNTKLYIRGQRGKDWAEARKLDKELFDALVPFLDELREEARQELLDELRAAPPQLHDGRSPEEIAITAMTNRGRIHGRASEASLVQLVTDIIDGQLEAERMTLRRLMVHLPVIIRNTPHSCQTQEHCCALHAAHDSAAEKVVEYIQHLLEG